MDVPVSNRMCVLYPTQSVSSQSSAVHADTVYHVTIIGGVFTLVLHIL